MATTYVAFMNFTGQCLLSRADAETAREDAAKHITYKGTTYRDHLDSVTVLEMDGAQYEHLFRDGRNPLLSDLRKRFPVVGRA